MEQFKGILWENTLDELTSQKDEEPSGIKSHVSKVLPKSTSQENEEPKIITSLENEEPSEITSQKIEQTSEITPQVNQLLLKSTSQNNEEPLKITFQINMGFPTITSQETEEPSEITSFRINGKLPEITPQQATDEPSQLLGSSDEEGSFDSSNSDDVFEGLSEVGSDEDDRETADFESEEDSLKSANFKSEEDATETSELSDLASDQSITDSADAVILEQCVDELKQWVKTEVDFYGRTDSQFLVIFLLGCKMDIEKAKTKITKYYQNRLKNPQTWANRDLKELESLFQLRTLTVLSDSYPDLPTIVIQKSARAPSIDFNIYMKMFIVYLEIAIRRSNCQKNGFIWIMDCSDFPFWAMQKLPSPITLYNFVYGLYTAMPIRLKGFHIFNFPLLGRAAWRLMSTLLSPKMKKRFVIYGSDLSALKDNVDNRLLPEEYGGQNGSLVDHEEACLKEVLSYSDYFLDDNKFGFQ